MDVERLIEKAVLEMRLEAGYRVTRRERQRLEELRAYLSWRQALDDDSEAYHLALWGDSDWLAPPQGEGI